MGDESLSSNSFQHRFGIVDVLGENSRNGSDLITSTISEPSLSMNSIMFEKDESIVLSRLKELYPFIDLQKESLPRYWNETAPSLSRTQDFLRVHYIDKGGRDPKQAAAARANRPVPNMTIVYYFEIYVANKGEKGFMGVGLTSKKVEINRLPGWDEISYGYHGDDGHFFESAGKGISYGPTYTTGDTIGCGINFMTRELFFTKNGEFLGIASKNVIIEENLYPTAGMQTNGEMIDVNFGQKPFKFDIESYRKRDETIVSNAIKSIDMPPEKAIWMNKTIFAWLQHEGYSRALKSLKNATGFNIALEDENDEMENRRFITRLIQEGKTFEAVKKVENLFPSILNNNKELILLLKIQQFVEMVLNISEENFNPKNINKADLTHNLLTSDKNFEIISSSLSNIDESFNGSTKDSTNSYGNTINSTARSKRLIFSFCENNRNKLKRRSSGDNNDSPRRLLQHNNLNEESMDIFHHKDYQSNGNSLPLSSNGFPSIIPNCDTPPTSTTIIEELGELNDFVEEWEMTAESFYTEDLHKENGCCSTDYFQHLQKYLPIIEFGHAISKFSQQISASITSPSLFKRMNDAFSLIGYNKPYESNNNYLLEQKQRNVVAKALNRAILDMLGKEKSSRLDYYIRKTRSDRQRSLTFSTASIYSDVDKLLFYSIMQKDSINKNINKNCKNIIKNKN